MNKRVFLLGPCHKINRKSGHLHRPFDPASRSGRFLRDIMPSEGVSCIEVVYDNILPNACFNQAGKECLPTLSVLTKSLEQHKVWNNADIVVGFGTQVRAALEQVAKERARVACGKFCPSLIYLPHPSYVLRRPAPERESFCKQLRAAIYA